MNNDDPGFFLAVVRGAAGRFSGGEEGGGGLDAVGGGLDAAGGGLDATGGD